MSDNLTDEQAQRLMDAIILSCEDMDLDSEQILDGLGRAMLSAALTFEKSKVTVTIQNVGECHVALNNAILQD